MKRHAINLFLAAFGFVLGWMWRDHQVTNERIAHAEKLAAVAEQLKSEAEREKETARRAYLQEHKDWQQVYTAWLAKHPQYQQEKYDK